MKKVNEVIDRVVSLLNKLPNKNRSIGLEETIKSLQSQQFKESIKGLFPKKKKLKDENAPKKAKTSYMYFCDEMRSKLRDENPEMKMTEITKILGSTWKDLSDDEKGVYVKKASKDKKRFENEIVGYVRPSDDELVEQKVNKKTSRKKEDGAPKSAICAFFFFSKEKRSGLKQENPEMKPSDISKELGRMWNEEFKDVETRKRWIELADNDKKRYIEEKEMWDKNKIKGDNDIEDNDIEDNDIEDNDIEMDE
jgi:hypothetical protein